MGLRAGADGESGLGCSSSEGRVSAFVTRYASPSFFGASGHGSFAFARSENRRLTLELRRKPESGAEDDTLSASLALWRTYAEAEPKGSLLHSLKGREEGAKAAASLRLGKRKRATFSLSAHAARFAGGDLCLSTGCRTIRQSDTRYGGEMTLWIPFSLPQR